MEGGGRPWRGLEAAGGESDVERDQESSEREDQMYWYFVIFVVGVVIGVAAGIVIEQKFDLLKPRFVRIVEAEIRRLRDEIRIWRGVR
jgi:hypothetical protein